jgi:branched-chain amino acid transport system ATP-binding protein
LLEIKNVTKRFGGLVAVNDVTMNIQKGRITGLIGPNGAGKTTLFNCINGIFKPSSGTIVFNDKNIEGMRPCHINERGIARTYQIINLFSDMSVIDNVMVGMHSNLKSAFFDSMLHTKKHRTEEAAAYEKAYELLKEVGLDNRAKESAGSLPFGDQRLLEIVRGLASNPQLILLDEPASGMNSKEKDELDELLRKILQSGVSILMVEHDMRVVMGICDYIYVLYYGKKLAEGTPQEIQNNQDVIDAYLGGDE